MAVWALPHPAPLTAPLTALLVVQVTLYATLTTGIRRANSVVVGVLIATALSALVGLDWWSLGLTIFASLITGGWCASASSYPRWRFHRGKEETVLRTLSYVDGVSFAARGSAPALFSVALMDQVCPPSTVFAAHNAYPGEKEIEVYPFNGDKGGAMFQEAAQLRWVPKALNRTV